MSTPASPLERRDVVIIGARCAGAAMATYLGRAGVRVLLVDKSPLPSDVVLSTHTLHPAGSRVLAELGLLDALREVTPPIRQLRIGRGDGTLDIPLSEQQFEYCPRRERFDGLLQDAAREAGAEVCERTAASSLLVESGRVVGVRLVGPSGTREVRAEWVVGADGRDSWLAEQVQATEYLDYDAPRGIYWSYWDAPPGYGASDDYPCGMYVVNRSGMLRIAFHTDHDQVLVGSLPERSVLGAWRQDPLGSLQADLAADPMLASFTRSAPRARVRGFLPPRYFLRQAVGPGWLLVGDAGVHKEFVTGDGMSEALLQAKSASAALLGGQAAIADWWRARDRAALPFFLFGKLQGAAGAPSRLDALVIGQAARCPATIERFARSLMHELSPLEAVSSGQVLRWVAARALSGQPGVLADLWRHSFVLREMQATLARDHTLPAEKPLVAVGERRQKQLARASRPA
jgi:menaquinone-9 beta-reductase